MPTLRNSSKRLARLLALVLFVLGVVQYLNTLNHDYAWDDKLVITQNEYTLKGIDGIPEILTEKVSVPYKNVYRPVPQVIFALEYEFAGLNPRIGHLFNCLWYGLLCVFIFLFIRKVFPGQTWLAFASALLFAVHPLHVEVVANIKSRDEILAMLLGLFALLALVKGTEKQHWAWMLMGALCWGLAILSKMNAITLLPIYWLVLWYRNKLEQNAWWLALAAGLALLSFGLQSPLLGWTSALVLLVYALKGSSRKWLLLPIAICLPLAHYLLVPHLEPTSDLRLFSEASTLNNILIFPDDPSKIVPTAILNMGRYLKLFVYPHPLVHLYGYQQVPLVGWENPSVWASLLIYLLGGAYAVWGTLRRQAAAFGLAFFLTTISIYSNLLVTVPDTMADRYAFLPSLGLCLCLVAGMIQVTKINWANLWQRHVSLVGVIGLFTLLCSLFFVTTWQANRDWKDDATLIQNRIHLMENNAAAQANLGFILLEKSDQSKSPQEVNRFRQEAMGAFFKSVDLYPDFYMSWVAMGKIFAEVEKWDKAEIALLKAISVEPEGVDGHFSLGMLYSQLNAYPSCIAYLERAIVLQPTVEQAYAPLGKSYFHMKYLDKMEQLAHIGLEQFPSNGEFDAILALYHHELCDYSESQVWAQSALRKSPGNLTALSVLASRPQFATP